MNTLLLSAAAVSAAIAAAFAFAPRSEVRTEVTIDAPPSAVWSVLTDAARYRDWNPFLVEMRARRSPAQHWRTRWSRRAAAP